MGCVVLLGNFFNVTEKNGPRCTDVLFEQREKGGQKISPRWCAIFGPQRQNVAFSEEGKKREDEGAALDGTIFRALWPPLCLFSLPLSFFLIRKLGANAMHAILFFLREPQ